MPNQIHHGGYPIGTVDYVPKSFERRGAFIRYISAKNVIWLLKPDVESYFAQLDRQHLGCKPKCCVSNLERHTAVKRPRDESH